MKATMTIPQACAALGRSYNTVMRMIFVRELRGEQRGRRWFVNAADVERLQERETRQQPVDSAFAGHRG